MTFPDLTNTFAHCGYYTQWITNQKVSDIYAVEKTIASSAHDIYATNKVIDDGTNKVMDFAQDPYDETLLSVLERYDGLKNTTKKNGHSLTVIHLMGSHVFYNQRYPPKPLTFFKAKGYERSVSRMMRKVRKRLISTPCAILTTYSKR